MGFMEKIRLRQAVVVEGKYDRIKLESLLDALILPVGGFQVYKNREKQALLRSLAKTCGLIILTDSDRSGFRIRGYLSGILPEGEVTHVYIPDIRGKEKRKTVPSAEGKLGVEGMDLETLRECFRRAGVLETEPPPAQGPPITVQDFYEDGLTGKENSASLRRKLYRQMGLPERMSTSSALAILNRMLSREEYKAALRTLYEDVPGEGRVVP